MLQNDLILRNPLKFIAREDEILSPAGGFGAVLARAGVGKTAFMVQLALYALLQQKKVLHISLNDPVSKVNLWYEEVLRALAETYDRNRLVRIWESAASHRFIMTFKVEGFSVPKLQERLTDLTVQNIFAPEMILIDGLPFDEEGIRDILLGLKELAVAQKAPVWYTVTTHRHEAPGENGLPVQLEEVKDLFDVAVLLQPDARAIHVEPLLGKPEHLEETLVLDPATMLVKPA